MGLGGLLCRARARVASLPRWGRLSSLLSPATAGALLLATASAGGALTGGAATQVAYRTVPFPGIGLQTPPSIFYHPPAPPVAPLGHLRQADLMVVSPTALPASTLAAVRGLRGVTDAQLVDGARVRVDGQYVPVLGVDPSLYRDFTAKRTAAAGALWRDVAAGEIVLSTALGGQAALRPGHTAFVTGASQQALTVGGQGGLGILGLDAVVSNDVADSLGFPMGNAIVISTGVSAVSSLAAKVRRLVPPGTAVEQLVADVTPAGQVGDGARPSAPRQGSAASDGGLVTAPEVTAMLRAALSRVGMPYVWGAAGPRAFDCSGLVQWSFARAGLVMPRVAADQALTGPFVPVSRLVPGDLLFYHTDPGEPDYVSHVAIYLGDGKMIQAPETGMDVEVVPVALGPEYAGAVQVSPRVAATVAGFPPS